MSSENAEIDEIDTFDITIPFTEYVALLNSRRKLKCLEEAGVSNWNGYFYAMNKCHSGNQEE